MDFLEKSQSKDHEFFEHLAEKEAETELKSQKLMFDCIKEIANIFKGDDEAGELRTITRFCTSRTYIF